MSLHMLWKVLAVVKLRFCVEANWRIMKHVGCRGGCGGRGCKVGVGGISNTTFATKSCD